jgi:hypothetical protein
MSSSKTFGSLSGWCRPAAGEAEVHRQRPVDLGAPGVKQLRLVGDRRRHAVANDVHRHRPLVEEAEVEELHSEWPAGRAEERPVGAEADVAIGVELEPVQRLGQRRNVRLVGGAGELARPAHHVLVAERRRRRRSAGLGRRRRCREGHRCGEETAAGQTRHRWDSGTMKATGDGATVKRGRLGRPLPSRRGADAGHQRGSCGVRRKTVEEISKIPLRSGEIARI